MAADGEKVVYSIILVYKSGTSYHHEMILALHILNNSTYNSGRTSKAATNWLSLNHTWDVPDSCCVKVTVGCGAGGVNVTDETKIHQTVSS